MNLYLEHFGLREAPFSLTPDTAFFFEGGPHREALETLEVALAGGEGFLKVTGEVGTGKSLLCRTLLNMQGERYYAAYVPNPELTPAGINRALADELGLELPSNLQKHGLYKAIARRLIGLAEEGLQPILVIDEAQAMPEATLEALRLLTNLETEKRKLLQVVLFGQPELDERLEQPSVRQLRQRITFSHRLRPLTQAEVKHYLAHRLERAGAPAVAFTGRASRLLGRASGGIPRLVNILAHKSLMVAYGEGEHRLRPRHVKRAIDDTEGLPGGRPRRGRRRTYGAAAVALSAAALWLALAAEILPGGPA